MTQLLAALFATFAITATAMPPVKIVAIGDSITQGGKVGRKEYTYRWALAEMLADEGACVDFIGSHRSGLDASARWPREWDSDNEGYYGATTAFVRDKLIVSLPKLSAPDIALVHLGTNDSQGSVEADIIAPLRQIVELLRKSNPRVTVLLAEIPASRLRGPYLHFRVQELADDLSTSVSVVIGVDLYSGWSPARDTFDGVHPNLIGQRRMAETWLAAMYPYLHLTPTSDGC